ncbi:NFX1-type zinc finger-containing protein 1-like [Actinia tenebrosa]|uniref:NFX1-type zinc finger-containing protein 1-like n=1 Tax=Actinia tenebrosa TaxID=6105 RepID=A0A6P8IES7_ACTTE|nr:NFX1-type zinc finger-containing protein 1-like [Actinia tenebrosa]XP_031564676.1 NFX1-type zinc finger-containing protein 1-like [Actinia tenebrosa]
MNRGRRGWGSAKAGSNYRSGYRGQGRGRGNYSHYQEESAERPPHGRGGTGARSGRRGPILGYKRLESLKSKTPDEVVDDLLNCKDSFNDLIFSEEIKSDWIPLLIHVIANASKSLMKENANELLFLLKESKFLSKHLKEYILELQFEAEDFDEDDLKSLLQSLTCFFRVWLSRFPGSGQKLPLDEFRGCLNKLDCDVLELQDEVDGLLDIRDQELRSRTEQKKKKKAFVKGCSVQAKPEVEGTPPDDFHELSVEPRSEEINSSELPFLRRIRTGENETYDDLDHYLDVQFRLLREDFVGPLREGIREIKSGVSKEERSYDLSMYEDVKIIGPGFSSSGLIHRIYFRPFVKRKDFWQHSKRVLFGSFLCLSKDNFKTMTFATVADRKPEELAKGFLDVRFIDGVEPAVKSNEKIVMVESPAYFESYRHVLQRLKEIKPDQFPFQEYLVSCSPDVKRPAYLTDLKVRCDLTEALSTGQGVNANVEVLNPQGWPSEDVVKLNRSQYEALKAALTKEFVVIQGPPGTGKTYVGLKIVRALMDNRAVWKPKDPAKSSCMLMVCYTNHALDQFLEGILEFQVDGVVRVGGRSKSEVLQNHNLHELTRLSEGQRRVYRETKESQEYLEKCLKILDESRRRILTVGELGDAIGIGHRKQLNLISYELKQQGLSSVEGWLGLKNIAPVVLQEKREEIEFPIDEMEDQNNIEVDYDADIIQSRRQIGDEVHYSKQAPRGNNKGGPQTKKRYAALSKQELEILKGTQLKPMPQKDAINISDLQGLDKKQRWALYLFWLRLFRSNKQEEIKKKAEDYDQQCKRLAEVKSFEEHKVLSQATVIGMTTTGAAKYSRLLEQIKPRIVVVEEAAEVLEAHIITSLTQETQHLILIGDHKQLRPNPTCYNLSQRYNLDVSLFERMVKGGMQCESLDIQHRMRPEISRVLKHIYEKLEDHPKVCEYKNVPGVKYNMYFINHNVMEDNNEYDQKLKSYSNKHEATYMVALCEYFLNQGYRPEEITLLTMYTGQLLVLRKLMPKERFQGVRVTAVDNFQGEENKIILLSLVRSNAKKKIGFLGIENRVCVALSRAQEGFFCIGNFTMLAEKSGLWKKIVEDMKKWEAIGSGIELVCMNHPEKRICAKTAGDFINVPEGGCLEPCSYRLKCGHECLRVCHPVDPDHEQYKCRKKCLALLCSEHDTRCNSECHFGTPCKGCEVKVVKVIPKCGHEVSVPCGVPPEAFQCQEQCRTRFGCRHICPKKCFEQCDPSNCKVQISKELNCGHVATGNCSEIRQSSFQCQEPCKTILECGHACGGSCSSCKQGRLHVTCQEPCQRILVCQHRCTEPCSKDCPPCTEKCENRCIHSRCPLECQDPCTPCKEMCSWECQRSCRNRYKCKGLCSEKCTRPRCDTPCFKLLSCQHRCIGLCGEPCPKLCIVCDNEELTALYFGGEDQKGARFIELVDCKHVFEVNGMDNWMSYNDDEEEQDQPIQLKCCPKCKTPIRRTYRYADLVKEKLHNIERVKKKILQEERKLEEETENLLDFLDTLSDTYPEIRSPARTKDHDIEEFEDEEEREEDLEAEDEVEVNSTSIWDTFKCWLEQRRTLTELNTMQNQLLLLEIICELKAKIEKDFELEDVESELNVLLGKVVSTIHIPHQQIKDVRDEVARIGLELKLRHLKCKIKDSMTLLNDIDKVTLQRVEKQLTNGARLREREAKDIDEALMSISARYGVRSLTREEWPVTPSMGLSTGHWYKCPNGHINNQVQYADQTKKTSVQIVLQMMMNGR